MNVLAAVLLAGVLGGVAGALAVVAWPRHDPTAPHLTADRVRRFVLHHRHLESALRRHVDPAAVTVVVLGAAATVLAATLVGAGLLLLLATSDPVTGRTDGPIAEWAAANITEGAAEAVRTISRLGGFEVVLALTVAVAVVEHRRHPARGLLPFLVLVVVGQFLVIAVAKEVIDRARPDVLQLTGYSSTSFPSGHATAGAACFAAFALLLGRGRSRTAHVALGALAGAVALAVAATRVALGVHWTTDVVAGLVVGWGWFTLCSIAVGGPALLLGEPVAVAQAAARRHGGGDTGGGSPGGG